MSRPSLLAAVLIAAVTTLAAGCNGSPSATTEMAAVATASHDHADARAGATVPGPDLAALKRETAPFHVLARANAAGWDTAITPCWYSGTAGGAMGYHYGDTKRIDGVVDALKPEALIYEPLQGGQMSLVGVEYIVPIAAWTQPGRPQLYGRDFDRNDALGLYVMHVWAWRENPAGIFAAWNAKVSCQHAAQAEDRG